MELFKDDLKDNRYDGFSKLCSMINEENIHYFRNNGYFKLMVENVSLRFSNEYYRIIKEKYRSLFSKIDWKKLETLSNIGSCPYGWSFQTRAGEVQKAGSQGLGGYFMRQSERTRAWWSVYLYKLWN